MKTTVERRISKQSIAEKFQKRLVNGKKDFYYEGFILLTQHEYEDIDILLADDKEWFEVFFDKQLAIQEATLDSEPLILFRVLFLASAIADARLASTRKGHIRNDTLCLFDFERWSLQEIKP